MGEQLRLARTFGIRGWKVWHSAGEAFALAALGTCFLQPRAAFALRGLWRLLRLWYAGLEVADARALRLALCMDGRVRLAGISVQVTAVAPTRAARPVVFKLPLQLQRGPDARLSTPPAGSAWRVLRLAPAAIAPLARLTHALTALPKGTGLQLQISAKRSAAPDTLRAVFPLRVEALIDADEGYFPLIRAVRLSVFTAEG